MIRTRYYLHVYSSNIDDLDINLFTETILHKPSNRVFDLVDPDEDELDLLEAIKRGEKTSTCVDVEFLQPLHNFSARVIGEIQVIPPDGLDIRIQMRNMEVGPIECKTCESLGFLELDCIHNNELEAQMHKLFNSTTWR